MKQSDTLTRSYKLHALTIVVLFYKYNRGKLNIYKNLFLLFKTDMRCYTGCSKGATSC